MTLNFFTTNRSHSARSSRRGLANELPLSRMVSRAAYVTCDVLPGKVGRLHYLSTEWGACAADNAFIAKGTLVKPVSRRGNTWLVMAVEKMSEQIA
ncbi:MAG: hypothetical protein WBG38_17680 [Nodosilinea sp.]